MKRLASSLGIVGTCLVIGFVIGACSGSSTTGPVLGHSGSSGGGGSGGGGGGSSGGGSSGQGASDDGGGSSSGDDSGGAGSSSSGGSFNLNGWTCPSGSVLGGYSATCISCLETMCTSQLNACMTGSCSACEGPVFSCETQSCGGPCTPGSSGGEAGTPVVVGDGGAGTCAGLAKCCPLVSAVDPSTGSACTTTAATGNQMSCQTLLATIVGVAPQIASYCQ